MEKYTLKKGQIVGFCLMMVFCIAVNYGGSLFAAAQKLPLWLDAAGTAIAACLGGPVCGAIVGLTSAAYSPRLSQRWAETVPKDRRASSPRM